MTEDECVVAVAEAYVRLEAVKMEMAALAARIGDQLDAT